MFLTALGIFFVVLFLAISIFKTYFASVIYKKTGNLSIDLTAHLLLLAIGFALVYIGSCKSAEITSAEINFYKDRYKVEDVLTKIVDNHGNGFNSLYGVRNMRVVLHGVFYRGGANNLYHRESPRDNMNPLQDSALVNLCKEGFVNANYLYSTNYSSAGKLATCRKLDGRENRLVYTDRTQSDSSYPIYDLRKIEENIRNYNGPFYYHCWNGWHASGYVAAIVLKQFCDFTDDMALEYWVRGTDSPSNAVGYNEKKEMIKKYKKRDDIIISKEIAVQICPLFNR